MWNTDKQTIAKYGSYRVCIKHAKRARHRAAINRMVETFMDSRILVMDNYHSGGVQIFCACNRQANMLASHFNGEISYLLKVGFSNYSTLLHKSKEVQKILEENGHRNANLNNYYHFEVQHQDQSSYLPRRVNYFYLPCRKSAIMAKLSLPDLADT